MTSDVTVIGMGAMGRALASALVAAGRSVTVWNRTPGRSVPGAVVAGSAAEAVAASRLVVVCVVDNDAMYAAVPADALAGRTVVNLTNGSPRQARDAAEWAERHGASYVDGGIMAVPRMIGSPASLIFYSGSPAGFAEGEEAFAVWGRARYLGADAGVAALYDLALLSAMYGMFGGVYHALALGASEKVPAAELAPLVADWLTAVMGSVRAMADGVGGSADSNLAMQATAYVNLLDASRDQGVRTDLVTAMGELLHRAVAAGPGVSMVDLLRE